MSRLVVPFALLFMPTLALAAPATTLEALAKAIKEGGEGAYVIEGHTDDRGGAAFNQGLSEKRAASVKKWLTEHGVDGKSLKTNGYGQSRPSMPNDSEAGRAANRRVEVAVEK